MYQLILDNIDWKPPDTQRYIVVQMSHRDNLNHVIYKLINMYIFDKYNKLDCKLLPREYDKFWISQRNWWNFFYFVSPNREIIFETSKPLWYIVRKYNITPSSIDLRVKTRNSIFLNDRIMPEDLINMTNYHTVLDDVLYPYIPVELIYYICDYIY